MRIDVAAHTYTHVNAHTIYNIYDYIIIHPCIHVYITHTHTHTHTHIHIHTHTYVHTHTYINYIHKLQT